jgi:hypothetical protein
MALVGCQAALRHLQTQDIHYRPPSSRRLALRLPCGSVAAWLLVNSKTGISATHLRREMEHGSIQTALPHRYRTVMVRP